MDREKNSIMRRSIGFLCLLLLPMVAYAEHLFEFGLHGGAAGWSTQTIYVNKQLGYHAGAQLCYTYLSPRVIGFRTGVMADNHHAGFGKTDYEDSYSTIDVENQLMEIDYSIGLLNETYSIWSVGVPLQVVFSKKNVLFLVGAKATFPLANSWKQTVDQAALSVYYPDYDNRVYESYPLAASRDFSMRNTGQLTMPKVQWWLSMELSYAIPLNTWATKYRSYLLVGAYFDYCFTPYKPSQSNAESLIMLSDTRDGFPLQRLLTPVMEANRQERKLVSNAKLLDFGIKISYAISPYDAHHGVGRACNCLQEDW